MELTKRSRFTNPNTGKPYRALVVDDSAFIIKQLSYIMSSVAIEVVGTAQNGNAAIEMFRQLQAEGNVDFITLDITMPQQGNKSTFMYTGMSVLEEILAIDRTAKVVMVSALSGFEVVKKCLLLGAKGYITKPFFQDEVVQRLASILGRL
jgi:two-component system chemotaxis response regulator CheY